MLLQRIWLTTLTAPTGRVPAGWLGFGTNSPIKLIMPRPRPNIDFSKVLPTGISEGEARQYVVDVSRASPPFDIDPTTRFPNLPITISILGDDAWRPLILFAFGELAGGAFLPLAIVKNPNQLSTDPNEGQASVRLDPVPIGDDDTKIQKLALITHTANTRWAGTDNHLSLRWYYGELGRKRKAVYRVPDTDQTDLEQDTTNVYALPWSGDIFDLGQGSVPDNQQFTRRSVRERGGLALIIDGSDAWLPSQVFLFGISDNNEFVTLVAQPRWEKTKWFSTDRTDSEAPHHSAHAGYALPIVP